MFKQTRILHRLSRERVSPLALGALSRYTLSFIYPGFCMPNRTYRHDAAKGVLFVDWPLFGEVSRALALKVARDYDPEIVVGIATAGVVPGATVAAILGRPFHSILVSRRYSADHLRDTPAVFGAAPVETRGKRVLLVDETCDSGDTIRLAVASLSNGGAREVRTAVSFRTGAFRPDYEAVFTESAIVLPWDREVLDEGELIPNPKYDGLVLP
jgi:uncharacterized protein